MNPQITDQFFNAVIGQIAVSTMELQTLINNLAACFGYKFLGHGAVFGGVRRALIEAGAEYILVPSCTDETSGYWRVRIGAMSRALEGQCVTAMASLISDTDWSETFDISTGMGGIFGPPDIGFPATGVLAEGEMGQAGWTIADAPRPLIEHVRAEGIVRNSTHWGEQGGGKSAIPVTYCDLR